MAVALRREEHIVKAFDQILLAVIKRAYGDVAQSIVERPEQCGDAAFRTGNRFERLEVAFDGRNDHGVKLIQLRPRIG